MEGAGMRGRIRSAFVPFAVTAVWFAAPAAAQSIEFDTSGLPSSPTTFEEQKLWDSIVTVGGHPSLAPQTHLQLADYYDRHGKSTLAAKERDAAGGVPPAATPASPSAPASPPAPAALASSADPTDATTFDLSAFPATPASFEEQRIRESLSDPHTLTNPSLLA